MKKIAWIVVIALLGLGLNGCCCLHKSCGRGSGNKEACMMGKSVCKKCGMPADTCKCPSRQKQMPEINTAVLKTIIDSGTAATILDARTAKYDDGRRIPGARSLGADAKDEEILAMLTSKDALIVTYCANLKCPLSRTLAGKLRVLGYKHVLEYPYGIEGWAAEGNPVTQAAK